MTDSSKSAPVCVVTGGSAGVGLAVAQHFSRMGYRIAICGRDSIKLATAKQTIEAKGSSCLAESVDVGTFSAVNEFLASVQSQLGQIDVLVNNAGSGSLQKLEAITEGDYRQIMTVHVDAVFFATQTVWPMMKAQGGGMIVNISSMASVDPFPGLGLYGAAKAWGNLFTKATADEGKPDNIRVFSVALGAVDTDLLRRVFPDFPKDQCLSPDEVGTFIAKLSEPHMQHFSGQTFFLKR